jgi:uncharacterized OB-fold protein
MSTRHLPTDWTLPELTDWNRPFFTSGALTIQGCGDCGGWQHPPLDFCHRCQGDNLIYQRAGGTGVVDNVTVVHHAGDPRLAGSLPYNVVLVVPDGFPEVLVLGNVVDPDWPERLHIGARVRCVFAAVPAGDEVLLLPQWQLEGAGSGPEQALGVAADELAEPGLVPER